MEVYRWSRKKNGKYVKKKLSEGSGVLSHYTNVIVLSDEPGSNAAKGVFAGYTIESVNGNEIYIGKLSKIEKEAISKTEYERFKRLLSKVMKEMEEERKSSQ